MYEAMASFGGGPPTEEHYALYSRWALGGWGMVITGVSMNDGQHRHRVTPASRQCSGIPVPFDSGPRRDSSDARNPAGNFQ